MLLYDEVAIMMLGVLTAAERSSDLLSLEAALGAPFQDLGVRVHLGLNVRAVVAAAAVEVSFGRPSAIRDRLDSIGLRLDDPIIEALLGVADPFFGEEILADRPSIILSEASRLGLSDVLIVPQHRFGGRVGAVLLLGAHLRRSEDHVVMALVLLAQAYYRHAMRLGLDGQDRSASRIQLRPREAQALYWVDKGLGGKAVAYEMNLTQNTAATYIGAAQRRLGATNRIGAARAAAELGLLPPFLPPRGG